MPMFTYTSVCCGGPASKEPCVKPKAGKVKGRTTEQTGLGHWSCDRCGRSTKVTRTKRNIDDTKN